MITQMIRKRLYCVTDVRATGKAIPRKFLCVVGVHKEYLVEVPELHIASLPQSYLQQMSRAIGK